MHLQTEDRSRRLADGGLGPMRGQGSSAWPVVRKDGSQGRQGRTLPGYSEAWLQGKGVAVEVEIRGGHKYTMNFSFIFLESDP